MKRIDCPLCEGSGWVVWIDGGPVKADYTDKDEMQICPSCDGQGCEAEWGADDFEDKK